jgi:hypothetical protein
MPTLRERLDEDLKTAMRAKDTVRLETIRNVRGVIRAREIDGGTEFDEDAVMQVIRSLVKQRADSIEQYAAGGRDDLVAKETQEKALLEAYLPAAIDPAEVERIVAAVISDLGAVGMKDMGRVMKEAATRLGPAADGKTLSTVVKTALTRG